MQRLPPPAPAPARAVSTSTDRLIRSILTLAALALLAGAAYAQSADRVRPGGARAQANLSRGVASYYHASLHGRPTANGERYNHYGLSVAHRSLPFGTLLRVEAPHSGRRVLVRVNDRGPFIQGRQLDLSGGAADVLGMRHRGVARVRYEIVRPSTLPSRQAPPVRKERHV